MRVTSDSFGQCKCPKCETTLDIETTYEENISDCEGFISCPECNTDLYISNYLVFTAVLENKKEL